MQIVVNLVTKRVQMTVADSRERTQYDFKRGDGAEVEIIYVRDNIQEQLAVGSSIVFCCKEADKFDGPAIVFEDNFPLSGTGITAKYTGNPSFNTIPLDALLIVDGDSANDKSSVDLIGEVTWNDGIGGPHTSTITFKVRVDNDVYRGGENTPAGLPDLTLYLPTPLQLTAVPVDGAAFIVASGDYGPVTFGDLQQVGNLNGRPMFGTPTGTVTWSLDCDGFGNPGWYINYSADGGGNYYAWLSLEDVASPELVTTWTPYGDAIGSPIFTRVSDPQGTLGTLGQAAIVSTYNASGYFLDIWTCIQESPLTWKPPGEITRAPNGTLYRSIVANDGTPSTELAYP